VQHIAIQLVGCVYALHPALLDICSVLSHNVLKAVMVAGAASDLAELAHRGLLGRVAVDNDCKPPLVTGERQLVTAHSARGLSEQLHELVIRCPEGLPVSALNVDCPVASVQQLNRDLKIVEPTRAGLQLNC
jgi:hypothetical protein